MIRRWIAHQFARPSGRLGKWIIAPWLNRIGRRLNRLAFDLLAPKPGEALLEIGFGGGALLKRLAAARPAKLVGVDWSRAIVARGRKGGAKIVEAQARALPFADDDFDGLVSVSVVHFWPDLGAPLREMARVLRRSGRLVLVFECEDSLQRWPGHRYGFKLWTVAGVIEAAAAAGLALDARVEEQGKKPDHYVGLRFVKGVTHG
jgi:ubiquinone/menaquinone biosynthesis C-methylase UbiE